MDNKRKSSQAEHRQKRQQNVIQAMLKGSVTIPCNLQVIDDPNESDSVNLILFYKDKSMVPIYR